ncbi:MAG: hypothetical protein A4E53_03810 [Pelotomaculum sp. PtaB.Bin104]|nr:MAG: hypothetical protein A4E53_03810 [Pelotomaculum sp. PtaB.Bin104]
MKIVFLLPVISDARAHKRINALKKLGAQPVVLAFERDYYGGKPIPGGYQSLGHIEHSRYFKRLVPFLKALFAVRDQVKKADAIYAFGLDLFLLGWLACLGCNRPVKAVYEVADIREVLLGKGILSRCLRRLERFLLRRAELLVVTSEAFVQGYYRRIQKLDPLHYLVIENKLDAGFPADVPVLSDHSTDGIVRIGYFGVIRCPRSLEILREAAEQGNGRVQVYIRGFPLGVGDLANKFRSNPNIAYGGPYVAPDDLPTLYDRVDIIWACYPYQGVGIGNYRWARTNRFYEACYFKKPMFAQKGTEDCRVIEALGLGAGVDLSNIEASVERILRITRAELNQWRRNLALLPEGVYKLTNEHEQLLSMLETSTDNRLKPVV